MMKESAAIGNKSGIPKPYMKVTKMMFKTDEYLKCIRY
jgi:hypothetical protein